MENKSNSNPDLINSSPFIQGALKNYAREEPVNRVELDLLAKKTEGWGLEKPLLAKWINDYGLADVLKKVEYTNFYNPKCPGAYLQKSIKRDLECKAIENADPQRVRVPKKESHAKVTASANEKAPNISTEKLHPTDEQNVCWYDKLSDVEKSELLAQALYKFPWFEEHLKYSKLSVLDKGFSRSSYFIMMMQIIDRADNKRRPSKKAVAKPVYSPIGALAQKLALRTHLNSRGEDISCGEPPLYQPTG